MNSALASTESGGNATVQETVTPATSSDITSNLAQDRLNPGSLKKSPVLSGLFPVDPVMVETIKASIRQSGFRIEEPVVVWRETGEIVDGHQKTQAALELELEEVPVVYRSFPGINEAFDYAVQRQRDRRNMTKEELDGFVFRAIEAHDVKLSGGRPGKDAQQAGVGGKSAEKIAKDLGVNSTKVERARTVMARADAETKDKLRKGDTTINRAYKKTVEKAQGDRDVTRFQPYRGSKELGAYSFNPVTGYGPDEGINVVHAVPPSLGTTEPRLWSNSMQVAQKLPAKADKKMDGKLVRCCEFTDLGAPWVKDEWREKVFDTIRKNTQWTFFISTKYADRLLGLDIPSNVCLAVRVFEQAEVPQVMQTLKALDAKRRAGTGPGTLALHAFPQDTIENLEADITGSDGQTETIRPNGIVDWIIADVVEGQKDPCIECLATLVVKAKQCDCSVFLEHGLCVAPKEVPEGISKVVVATEELKQAA